ERTLPTDQPLLDDRHRQPAVRAAARGVLTRRAGADHDHVEFVSHPYHLLRGSCCVVSCGRDRTYPARRSGRRRKVRSNLRATGRSGSDMQLGMIGLGRMGANMTRRLMRGGHEIVVYDVDDAAVAGLQGEGAIGASSLDAFVSKLAAPRAAWI